MNEEEIKRLKELLDQRTLALSEKENDLAERMEEIESQKEELSAVVEELHSRNKALEVALLELKERNKELDQILYRASHDLRTPVSSIMGVLNLLKYEQMTNNHRECLVHIRTQGVQMDQLLTSLSTLSKTIVNDIHYSTVDLRQCLIACIDELSQIPNFNSVTIRTEINGATEILTDKLLFSIVIRNLLTNSLTFRKATKGGFIHIRTDVSDASVAIEVTDDGEGISEHIKDRIFDMFYRGSELSTGSGLGLYVVKKIVTRLNGSIEFVSDGATTTFRLVLPNGE